MYNILAGVKNKLKFILPLLPKKESDQNASDTPIQTVLLYRNILNN
jgi:hypothetical protein